MFNDMAYTFIEAIQIFLGFLLLKQFLANSAICHLMYIHNNLINMKSMVWELTSPFILASYTPHSIIREGLAPDHIQTRLMNWTGTHPLNTGLFIWFEKVIISPSNFIWNGCRKDQLMRLLYRKLLCAWTHFTNMFNSLRPRQNGRHFADDIFIYIFLNENIWISIKISLKFVPKGPINNIPALVQIRAWHRPGDKPLSELIMASFWCKYASLGLNELKLWGLNKGDKRLKTTFSNAFYLKKLLPVHWNFTEVCSYGFQEFPSIKRKKGGLPAIQHQAIFESKTH